MNCISRDRTGSGRKALHMTLLLTTVPAALLALAGCGGGSSSKPVNHLAIKQNALSAARTTRSTLAIAGLVSRVGPSAQAHALKARATSPGQDARTGLYYDLTANPDGSGSYALFTDAAHQIPAGSITWAAPQYAGGVTGTYPAVYHVVYKITAGSYQGNAGTADVTVKDASGIAELIHGVGKDQDGDNLQSDLNVDNGQISGTEHDTLPDGSTQAGQVTESAGGDVQEVVTFQDGSHAVVTEHPNGSESETLTGSDGAQKAVENNQAGGRGDVNFQDGSSDTVTDVNSQSGN